MPFDVISATANLDALVEIIIEQSNLIGKQNGR